MFFRCAKNGPRKINLSAKQARSQGGQAGPSRSRAHQAKRDVS